VMTTRRSPESIPIVSGSKTGGCVSTMGRRNRVDLALKNEKN